MECFLRPTKRRACAFDLLRPTESYGEGGYDLRELGSWAKTLEQGLPGSRGGEEGGRKRSGAEGSRGVTKPVVVINSSPSTETEFNTEKKGVIQGLASSCGGH